MLFILLLLPAGKRYTEQEKKQKSEREREREVNSAWAYPDGSATELKIFSTK